MLELLGGATALLCAYDVFLSRRRFIKYGSASEEHGLIPMLSQKVGLLSALTASIGIPWFLITLLCVTFNWEVAYGIYFGMRFKYFLMQLQSLKVEREIDQLNQDKGGDPPIAPGS